jgi:hypothetical protein
VATVTPDVASELRMLTTLVRRMFPHDGFPEGPYERTAAAILAAGEEDPRLAAQLSQGLRELEAKRFGELDADAALAYLREISATTFFASVRGKFILTFYDDREVWKLLGYEVDSFAQGGYADRGFADLDWLPAARVEEPSA